MWERTSGSVSEECDLSGGSVVEVLVCVDQPYEALSRQRQREQRRALRRRAAPVRGHHRVSARSLPSSIFPPNCSQFYGLFEL